MLQLSQIWPVGSLKLACVYFFQISINHWVLFLKISDSTRIFSSANETLVPLCGEWYSETKIPVLSMLIAIEVSPFLSLSVDRSRDYMNIYVYIYLCI